jgi:hypothetical protein
MKSPSIKVVIEQANLSGSSDDLQKVATVYVGQTGEYRVYAPPKARGSTLRWVEHFDVHVPDEGGEAGVPDRLAEHLINLVKQQLEIENEPAPEGRKLLESAFSTAKDMVVDLLAKYLAEMSKR